MFLIISEIPQTIPPQKKTSNKINVPGGCTLLLLGLSRPFFACRLVPDVRHKAQPESRCPCTLVAFSPSVFIWPVWYF